LKEFIDDEKVDITEIKHVVLDEIDLMLDSPVIDDIKKILKSVFVSGNH
jgi:superfamily II DNA/RNA helicase